MSLIIAPKFSFYTLITGILIAGCQTSHKDSGAMAPDSAAIHESLPPARIFSPREAMEKFIIEEGFTIDLVVSEPEIHDPVEIEFDERGRIWALEMKGYMPNIQGEGEDTPNGAVKILEDHDNDGYYEHTEVFLDSLILPRAMTLVYDGLLYAEPPNLWFVSIENDQPRNKVLVDSVYAVGGNVEHQPNGLYLGIDNWIYSAKSAKRYRRKNGKWIVQATEFRGQWGITKDDLGRLYYNDNSNQFRGDIAPPNLVIRNRVIKNSQLINIEVVSDQSVYPARPTPGINRGYLEGMLDEHLRLTRFTAACGPLIYRGHNFPGEYYQNGFVAEPSGNLVKRNVLKTDNLKVTGKQAYQGKEFLASTDERFRPVNLHNGPDGALYVVDMYRGIIQHKTYISDYLREEIERRGLEKPVGYGRIYRIYHEGTPPEFIRLSGKSSSELANYLDHPNGWVRDKAQHLLINAGDKDIIPLLEEMLKANAGRHASLHALWTLEGLEAVNPQVLDYAKSTDDPWVMAHALVATQNLINEKTDEVFFEKYQSFLELHNRVIDLHLAFVMDRLGEYLENEVLELLRELALRYRDDPLIHEAVLSSISGQESEFMSMVTIEANEDDTLLTGYFYDAVIRRRNLQMREASGEEHKNGIALYRNTCQSCHGEDGGGIQSLGPPLAESEWVTGDKEILIAITLYGMEGPVKVGDRVYRAPDIAPLMPGLIDNKDLSDQDIASVLTYIRQTWGHRSSAVTVEEVRRVRDQYTGRKRPFSVDEF